jgi:hypothetical protein
VRRQPVARRLFDYWGCPEALLDEAVAVVERLRNAAGAA